MNLPVNRRSALGLGALARRMIIDLTESNASLSPAATHPIVTPTLNDPCQTT